MTKIQILLIQKLETSKKVCLVINAIIVRLGCHNYKCLSCYNSTGDKCFSQKQNNPLPTP